MRLKVKFSKTNVLVPFNSQKNVLGYFHKILGANNTWHDAESNYCISLLMGGKMKNGKLDFSESNPHFFITSDDENLIETFMKNVYNPENSRFAFDSYLESVDFVTDTIYDGYNHFVTLSPILLKEGKTKKLITVGDEKFQELLISQTRKKLLKFNPNINLNGFFIEVSKNKSKTKKIDINGVINKVSYCSLTVYGNKEISNILYANGIGKSTGVGFGSLMKLENTDVYLKPLKG